MTLADVPEAFRPNIVAAIKVVLKQIPVEHNPIVWLIEGQLEECANNPAAEWEVILSLPITITQENAFTPPEIRLDLKPLPQED